MIYGDEPQQIGEYKDPLGTSRYVYAPQITAVMQAGNLYGYGSSNPVKWCDPTGKTYCDATKEWMCAGVPGVAISIPLCISLVELAKLGLTFVKEIGAWVRAKVIDGIWYIWLSDTDQEDGATIYEAGRSNPHDLEKGMSKRQKEMFQRAIEDYKTKQGMPPDHNLPWAILVRLAEGIIEQYK